MSEFPWDLLKAETLRSLCRDLGAPKITTRDPMISFLQRVEEQGLEKALSFESSQKKQEKFAPSSPVTPSKRRLGALVSDYDTRFKRARTSDPGTRASRRKSTQDATANSSAQAAPKRSGRPKKSTPKHTSTKDVASPSAPTSARREIFDGVVLPAVPSKGKGKTEEEGTGEEDADGDVEIEPEDEGPIPRVESSLASSNKENESDPGDVEPNGQNVGSPVEVSGNAGDGPSTRVLESTVQLEVPVGDDMDAEGEVVVDSDDILHGAGPSFPQPQETHSGLSADDVHQLEQVLRIAEANGL